MTRSDYLKLAAALERARRFKNGTGRDATTYMETRAFLLGVDVAAQCVCQAIARGNPKFDIDQFLQNAGAGGVQLPD